MAKKAAAKNLSDEVEVDELDIAELTKVRNEPRGPDLAKLVRAVVLLGRHQIRDASILDRELEQLIEDLGAGL